MPRSGTTHVLARAAGGSDNAYSRKTPSVEATVTLNGDCNALMLAAETAAVFVTFDDTTASATNGLPIIAGAQALYIPLGKYGHTSGKIHIFSATGVLHILQLS